MEKKMRGLLKITVLLLAVGLMLGLAGCEPVEEDDKKKSGDVEVDFTNHQTASIRVCNNTNVRLVAFKGLPDLENLLGGIPANANNHGLSRSGFNTSVDFSLYLVTEAEFNSKVAEGDNALAHADIFNVVYAFYNHTSTNNNVFQINAQSGGTGRLRIENNTPWNIELRNGGLDKPTLAFIGRNTGYQMLNLEPGDYIFYPVLRRFNSLLGEIVDGEISFLDGVLANEPYFRPLQISGTPITWDFREISQMATANLVSGGTFIRIVNNSQVAIEFYNGLTAQTTSMGLTFLNPGQTMVFQVKFPRNPDGSFSNTHTADFGVGVPGISSAAKVPPREVTLDWLYEIQVTGSSASNVVASELTEIQKMDIEGLLNAN